MRTVLALIAKLAIVATLTIAATGAAPAVAAGRHGDHRLAQHSAQPGANLTAKQRLWFGRAVAHILQGAR